ncbi:aromatic acid exporter family protein [Streptomyces sp. NPDC048208]|uniref:FUSC family protein n=1 Tax=Streptomyces sp. NPDC048208 TaxID=3365515 RepID=UPI00371F0D24
MRGIRATWQALTADLSTALEGARRAWAGPSRERDLVVQALKAALAAWVAWAVAGWWLQAPVAFVAPWVAVVLVESTVYRSLTHGLQQLAAIAAGTVVATAVGLALPHTEAAMAVVLPVVLLLGQWHRLGSQGIYAATGALFTLTAGPFSVVTSAARLGEALFGAVVGLAVNALIRPPVYLRDARALLQDTADEAHDILQEVAEGLAEGRLDADEATGWHDRAVRLHPLVEQAKAAVGWNQESRRINLRRRPKTLADAGRGYDDAATVLEYAAVHTAGVTRTVLETVSDEDAAPRLEAGLARHYARYLSLTAHALRLYSNSRFGPATEDGLRDAVHDMRETLQTLRQDLVRTTSDDPAGVAVYGALLAQAHRLARQMVLSAD